MKCLLEAFLMPYNICLLQKLRPDRVIDKRVKDKEEYCLEEGRKEEKSVCCVCLFMGSTKSADGGQPILSSVSDPFLNYLHFQKIAFCLKIKSLIFLITSIYFKLFLPFDL